MANRLAAIEMQKLRAKTVTIVEQKVYLDPLRRALQLNRLDVRIVSVLTDAVGNGARKLHVIQLLLNDD
jgi:hypothetical protein